MFITFRNTDEYSKVILTYENRTYTIEPESEIELHFFAERKIFTVECVPPDFSDELNDDEKPTKFTEKMIYKLTKKFVKKIPEMAIFTRVTYEVAETDEDCEIILSDGAYSSCDGEIADLVFDMMPVAYVFSQAETNKGELKVTEVKSTNRKEYLKLQKKLMLWMDWGLILPELFMFVPKYAATKYYYTIDRYVSKLIKGFYDVTPSERAEIFRKKEQQLEKDEKGGCLTSLLKSILTVVILFALLIGIGVWASSGEPEVVVAQDYSSVVYFDETFLRIEGGLPEDAEKVFLEDFYADYPEADGTYDSDSHYVYLYKDSKGDRYLWLITDYNKLYDKYTTYEEYENPLVYKSTGVKEN